MDIQTTLQQMYAGKNIISVNQYSKTGQDVWYTINFDDGTYDNKQDSDIQNYYTANQTACDNADLQRQIQQTQNMLKFEYNPIDVALNQNGEQDELISGLNNIAGATDSDSLVATLTVAKATMQNRLAGKSSIKTNSTKV